MYFKTEKIMSRFIVLYCSLFIFYSCSNQEKQKVVKLKVEKYDYKLVEIDSCSFRRAYHKYETFEGEKLENYMNRNPEPNEFIMLPKKSHPFEKQLSEIGLFKDGNLNLKEIDTLSDQFTFQVAKNKFFKVKTNYLDDPKMVDSPSYILTFMDKKTIVSIDTLEFDWPADVTFIKLDINQDGSDEFLSIYRWYIVNGDNFDIKIYRLKKK
jgi:hypothetical protein